MKESIEELGRGVTSLVRDSRSRIAFLGELTVALAAALRRPRRIRWRDMIVFAERAGVSTVPIVLFLGFLLGLAVASQTAVLLERYNAHLLVATIIPVAFFQEIGPLLTAIIMARRSGAGYAVELGALKQGAQLDEGTESGLSRVQVLVLPRIAASTLVAPLLAMFFIVAALIGGGFVVSWLGYPPATYIGEMRQAVSLGGVLGGLVKAAAFGATVSAVGCLRGLEAEPTPRGVGNAAASAVITAIVLVVIVDVVFAMVYAALGI